ncbi:DUF4364 family protein [Anaerotruncus rubiinfantis]|uniref:DUF4364 family protein n=1 Tax=Anaerotruncus rubiinfantis TaxID=1720200 RepID=UPI000830D1B6|nr:DUF4364 family protein [Anaerotruncus rubiinfantis]
MYDVFRAGVEPGGLTADYEIKILICYILKKLEKPMPVSALIEVFVAEGIGNYFEVASAASGLVRSGHIEIVCAAEGEKCYQAANLGVRTAEMFEKNLPLSVREKSVQAAQRHLLMKERRAHNKTAVQKVEDGYLLTLTITDVGSDLLSVTILLPDEACCGQVQERFLEDPVVVYKGIVALLTGSFENMGALVDGENRPQKG